MKIEMNKKDTSNYKSIRILCTDRPISRPVIGMFQDGQLGYFTETGCSQAGKDYDLIEIWEPQFHEWCLFWNNEESKIAVLAKFSGMTESGLFKDCGYSSWQYCAKFTGDLPAHLKE
jgi:hypothetical protein